MKREKGYTIHQETPTYRQPSGNTETGRQTQ